MKRFLLFILICFYPFVVGAHEGHGVPDLPTWTHYLLELVHGVWIAVVVVIFLIFRLLRDHAASTRTN